MILPELLFKFYEKLINLPRINHYNNNFNVEISIRCINLLLE